MPPSVAGLLEILMLRQVFYHRAVFFFLLIYFQILSPNASLSSWTQTLDILMLRQVLYHCGATADQDFLLLKLFYHFLTSSLYYKSFIIVIYNRNESGQCYKTIYGRKL
jgi:hypothetical protein